jgi:SAM-dependent methyltransferase
MRISIPRFLRPKVNCIICDSPAVNSRPMRGRNKNKSLQRTLEMRFCGNCGHVGIPNNVGGYETADTFASGSKPSANKNARVGDGQRPGREFRMVEMARNIVNKASPDVLIYGAGLSPDYLLVKKYNDIGRVAVTDVDNFMQTEDFIPLDASDQFDIVVACEVVEHFTDPHANFKTLFGFLKPGGLLICSTNIHDGGDLTGLKYPFITGHVSYYSGGAIKVIAERNGMQFDFRVPQCISGIGGPRKRYIMFYREPEMHAEIAVFFAANPYAFSE